MKKQVLLFILLLLPLIGFSRQEYFSLQGGIIREGSLMRRRDIRFDLNKSTFRPETKIVLDSIAEFLLKHPELTIEIGNHSNYVNPYSSSNLTKARACAVSDYMKSKGVPSSGLICIGYGDQRKLVSDREISLAKDSAKKDSLRSLNYRTEFRIRRIDAKLVPQFSFTDTAFFAGEIWRGCPVIYESKNVIRYEDRPCLDSLAAFLYAHPGMRIEIGSHTDSRGSDTFNLKISMEQAQFVADYLIHEKGIAGNRIVVTGYGESQPLAEENEILQLQTKAEIEKAHQQNRRTEFKIISVN